MLITDSSLPAAQQTLINSMFGALVRWELEKGLPFTLERVYEEYNPEDGTFAIKWYTTRPGHTVEARTGIKAPWPTGAAAAEVQEAAAAVPPVGDLPKAGR